MKRHCFTSYSFFALIGLVLSPLAAVAHAPVSPADSVHSYTPFDYEQWRRDHPRPAGKRLTLDVGEPRTVRMIYFLPSDRPYRQEVVDGMKTTIRQVQTFFAEQIQAHGYGNRTLRIETDAQGEPLVHRVDGRHSNRRYLQHDTGKVLDEIDQVFDIEANVYLIVVDNGRDVVLNYGDEVGGFGSRLTKNGGFGLVPGERAINYPYSFFSIVAHELGHAFGLWHDFRDNNYIMSYGLLRSRLSACNAEFLAVHTYFNPNSSTTRSSRRPTIEIVSPQLYPAGTASIPIQLKVSDSAGLHQVLLFGRSEIGSGQELKACRGLAGEKDAVVEFEYDVTTPSSSPSGHSISVDAVDTEGNVSFRESFYLAEISSYQIATLEGHRRSVESVAFSPDGTLLASGSFYGTILWDVETRRNIATLEGRRVHSVSFSPDGTLLASGLLGRAIQLWDVETRQNIATLEEQVAQGESVVFSPDGATLASAGSDDGTIRLWDVETRQNIATLRGRGDHRGSVVFSPDGTTLASAGADDSTIRLWDVETRRNIATLTGHKSTVLSVSFSPDGTTLASGGSNALAFDSTVRLWDVASRQNIATLAEHRDWVWSVAFSPYGTLLASGSADGTIQLWDVETRRNIATFYNPSAVRSVAFSPDEAILASGLEDGTIALWDVSEWAGEQAMPHTLTKVSGDGQEGLAGIALAAPFVVSVLDEGSEAIAGVAVTFSVTAGEGILSSTTATTDANGHATTTLTLMLSSDTETHTVSATVEGLESVTFTATAVGQAIPNSLEKVSGDGQKGTVGEALAEPFVVSVAAEDGSAISGVVVSFAVTAGGGTLSAATATTNANGRAATRLTLGSEVETNTVEATVAGLVSVTFTATRQDPLASLFDTFFGGGKRVAQPDRTHLLQNAPNPFNSQTVLSYFLLEPGPARLEVFSLTGQRVAVLHQGPQQAGYHRLHWDGRDAAGHSVASGAYLYRLVTDEKVLTRKLILLR